MRIVSTIERRILDRQARCTETISGSRSDPFVFAERSSGGLTPGRENVNE
jgi:hypothetical protein